MDESELFAMPAAAVASDDEESTSDCEEEEDDQLDLWHPDLPMDVAQEKRKATEFQQQVDETFKSTGKISTVELEKTQEQDYASYATPAAELLAWHHRMGHIPFARILLMAKQGDLPRRLLKAKVPVCASCAFGKQSRTAWRAKSPVNKRTIPPADAPGAVVGVDQITSSTPGLIGQMRGLLTTKRYTVTTVFVDHFSGPSCVHFQISSGAAHTIKAKQAFERYARIHGVTVSHYHADNHIFDGKEFVHEMHRCEQTISHCGVNAHHQNGKAEKKIRDLQDVARTMLLHAKQRWPRAITMNLWPFAARMANDIANHTPTEQHEESPLERFSKLPIKPQAKYSHTFGSPVHVLDGALQAGKRIGKWSNRSKIGIYLGTSPRHSRKIALVLNLKTGLVSPQFHCLYDDLCDTLRPSAGNATVPSLWQSKAGFETIDQESANDDQDRTGEGASNESVPNEPGSLSADRDCDSSSSFRINDSTRRHADNQQQQVPYDGDVDSPDNDDQDAEAGWSNDVTPEELPGATVTRSGRAVRAPERFIETYAATADEEPTNVPWEVFHDGGYLIQEEMEDPIAYALAASSNPDIMYLDEAMRAPDVKQFRKAMEDEVDSHANNDHFELKPLSEIPKNTPILPAVWAMRRKRRIATQEIYKWKARLNIHGGRQEKNVNCWETYGPVVGWPTIRMFLILMLVNGWVSKQVDFVLAFPQADIECDMYMEIPRGFSVQGDKLVIDKDATCRRRRHEHCLKLKKNLYGQKQAGRVWNQFMHEGLLARGFKQSKVDMCVYYRGSVMMMAYVDDGMLIGPKQEELDKVYELLSNEYTDENGVKHRAFKMTDEGKLSDYLGVKIEPLDNGTIKLSQPHLIQQILNDLGFKDNTTTKDTPAASSVKLHRDVSGKPHHEPWDYRSVMGKLNFLEKSTRCDLSYAVHQCARFANEPKESHSEAVKRIGRHLLKTKDRGIILDPKGHSFDCFVDADFAEFNKQTAHLDPGSAKSRTGYAILYAGCPMVWASKLQREVCLSTTESEYAALSESLKDVIFLMQLLEESKEKMKWQIIKSKPVVHCKAFRDNIKDLVTCKVYEDNSGAYEMARLPKMRPRTRHINCRMHHFREYVRKGKITVHKIPTRFQLADIATKPQSKELFESQRESLMQWESEFKTKKQLKQPTEHLRACDIINDLELLNRMSGWDQPAPEPATTVT